MDFHALLTSLNNFQRVLEATVRSWTNADAHWKPAPDKWCLCEILGHLAAFTSFPEDVPTFWPSARFWDGSA